MSGREGFLPSYKSRVVVPSPRSVAMKEIQLVNRVEEMQVLREAADRAIQGEGGVIFLHGEAGIGKTRLARELTVYARSQRMQVLSGTHAHLALFRLDGVHPYALWEEAIKDYLEVCTLEELQKVIGSYPIEVSKLIPELEHKLKLVPQSFPLSPKHSHDRLFEAISQFIINISREKALLLVLDDLQWTDQSSLLLMHYLARGVYKESLLVLGAYRDTYVEKKHPLSTVLTELNRERLLQSLSLKRMSFDEVSEMIERILEQDDVSREFCELVYEKTRGNPFFVEEVMKSLKEDEIIYRKKKRWEIREVSTIEFPETVSDVIKTRIGRLDDECQHVLTLASFIGKDFTFEALRGVTGIEDEKLLEMMDKMLKIGLIKQRVIHGEDLCSFADIIVRDVTLGEVSPLRRERLHGEVGLALEKVYAEKIDEHLGELAFHFLESGDKKKSLYYFLKAGEKAEKVYANNQAASYFQSALELLGEEKSSLRERGHVLEELGDIKNFAGEHNACIRYWEETLLLLRRLNAKLKVSSIHRKIANVLWSELGRTEKAKEHHDKASKILETEPVSVELASLYEDIAHMYYRTRDTANAFSWAEKALELAKKLKASEVIASSTACLGTILSITGDQKKARKYLERALKIALDNDHIETALRAQRDLTGMYPPEENERNLRCSEKALELAKKVGDMNYLSWNLTDLAGLHADMGNVNKALLLAEESVVLDRKTGNLTHLPISLVSLGEAYLVLGEWDKSEPYFREALRISKNVNDILTKEISYDGFGWFHFNKGEYAKAREFFEKHYSVSEQAGRTRNQAYASLTVIWTHIELGEIEKAKKLLDDLRKQVLKIKDKRLAAFASVLKAMLFRAQEKWEESIEHFDKSLQKFEASKARRWDVYSLARWVLCEYARVYLERGQEGDREKARNLLNQALEIFQKMGAKKDIEKTRSNIAYLETGLDIVEPKLIAEVSGSTLPSHVSTGYKELDDLLHGGLPRNYAVILTSPSCDERDLLIKRFLEAGAKEGQITLYVTTMATGVENLTEEFQSNFYLFICNPQADTIIKDLPNVFK